MSLNKKEFVYLNMKTILSLLLFLFTINLFAQNKHSELYNQVEVICRTILKYDIDSSKEQRIILSDYIPAEPLLVVYGIPFNDYSILDSIASDTIVSIIVSKPGAYSSNLYGTRGSYGVVILYTKSEYDKLFTKKKKTKIKKTNNH